MRKEYTKPMILVEAFTMDQPIAANCNMPKDIQSELMDLGCFTAEKNCMLCVFPDGGFDTDFDGKVDSHDTVCYHSNAQNAFTS